MDIKERIRNIDKDAYYSKANLHVHSTYSDGELSFDTLVEQAQNLGLEHFAITDHNTLKGYFETKYIDKEFLIPSVEFDCVYFPTLLHIIGYGVDIHNKELLALCSDHQRTLQRVFESRSPKKVIETIHKAGGMAVLAHPCCCWAFSLDWLVGRMKKIGLDGIETHYPYKRHRGVIKFHPRKNVEHLAKKYDLIMTGGSDEHGSLL